MFQLGHNYILIGDDDAVGKLNFMNILDFFQSFSFNNFHLRNQIALFQPIFDQDELSYHPNRQVKGLINGGCLWA